VVEIAQQKQVVQEGTIAHGVVETNIHYPNDSNLLATACVL
jgi:hypothetical protein